METYIEKLQKQSVVSSAAHCESGDSLISPTRSSHVHTFRGKSATGGQSDCLPHIHLVVRAGSMGWAW